MPPPTPSGGIRLGRRADGFRLAGFLSEEGTFGAEQVLEEVFMPLDVGAKRIGTPKDHDAGHVGGIVGASTDSSRSPDLRRSRIWATISSLEVAPGLDRLFAGFEGIFLELRVERQPAEPRGKGVAVRRVIGEAPLAVGGVSLSILRSS